MYTKMMPPAAAASVLGGEASSWDENVDAANVDERVFHRLPPVAERLWSPAAVTSLYDARNRMAEFRCKQLRRGILAGPTFPDYCDVAAGGGGGGGDGDGDGTTAVIVALAVVAAALLVALVATCWKLSAVTATGKRGARLLDSGDAVAGGGGGDHGTSQHQHQPATRASHVAVSGGDDEVVL